MTTFPQPDPDPGTSDQHRDTSHIRAGGHATPAPGSARGFPPGPVPGDAQPKQDSDRPLPTSEQPGAPGKPPVPTN